VLLGGALGLSLGPQDYIALLAVSQLALAVPAAAGLGAFEVVVAHTLGGLHVDAAAAGAYVLALHVLLAVPVTLAGLALLWAGRDRLAGRPAPV